MEHREGESQKCVFRLSPSRAHGGTRCAPLTSLATRKKSRFAEKKSATPKKKLCLTQNKWRIVCIKGGVSLSVVACHNRPSRGSLRWLRLSPSCASGFAFRLHGVISDGGLTAIDAIDAIDAIGAMGAMGCYGCYGCYGWGGWGCPVECFFGAAVMAEVCPCLWGILVVRVF